MLGAGPTGLILAQLLKLNGAHKVTLAANKGIKMDIAKQLDCADEYIELDRQNPGPQWEQLKKDNPYGFDVVVRGRVLAQQWRRCSKTILYRLRRRASRSSRTIRSTTSVAGVPS